MLYNRNHRKARKIQQILEVDGAEHDCQWP